MDIVNLKIANPSLSIEWHSTKNGQLRPSEVSPNSHKKVWWKCKHGHEWESRIDQRHGKNYGCPFCAGRYATSENNLQKVNPNLAKEWHTTKNGQLRPSEILPNSHKKVWWQCKYGHEWQAIITNRNKGQGCRFCAQRIKRIKGKPLSTTNPQLSKEWHPTKNGLLKPNDVSPNSNLKAWWRCKKEHEWQAIIGNRNKGIGCPLCHSSTSVLELKLYSELKYLFNNAKHREKIAGAEIDIYIPNLKIGIEIDGSYWHNKRFEKDKEKNQLFKKKGISLIRVRGAGLHKISENDICYTKKTADFDIIKEILNIILTQNIDKDLQGKIQTYIKNYDIKNNELFLKLLEMLPSPLPGKSLFELNKELSKEWCSKKNGTLTSKDVTPGSGKKAWWKCNKCGHEFQAVIGVRNKGTKCRVCVNREKNLIDNSLEIANPTLAKEWHPTKNQQLSPKDVSCGSHRKVWWKCKNGHEWQTVIKNRNKGSGCPHCSVYHKNRTN